MCNRMYDRLTSDRAACLEPAHDVRFWARALGVTSAPTPAASPRPNWQEGVPCEYSGTPAALTYA
jgi:hypothetical protein